MKWNYVLNGLLSAANVVYPLLTIAYVSRVIGPEALGRYYFALSLAAFFSLIAGIGIPIYGAREVAKLREDRQGLDRLFSELMAINWISTACVLLLYLAAVFSVPAFSEELPLMILLGAGVIFNAFSVEFLFVGMENYRNIVWRSLATKTASFILIVLLVREKGDLFTFAAIGAATGASHSLLGFLTSRSLVRLVRPGPNARRHLAPLTAIALNLILVSVYTNLDSVLLGFCAGPESVGLYNAGVRVNRILIALLSSAGVVLLPRMSYYFDQGLRSQAATLAAKSLSTLCFLAFPAFAFVLAAAPELTRLVFGEAFAPAANAMRITSPLVVVIGFTNFIGLQVLFPHGEERAMLAAVALAAVVDVGLILILAPIYGHEGAALALLAAEVSVLAVQWVIFRRRYRHVTDLGVRSWRYLLASPAAAGPAMLLRFMEVPALMMIPLAIALGGAVYLGALLVMKDPISHELLALAAARLKGRTPTNAG